MPAQASPLTRYLCAAYTLLVIYGSLHPFSGWTDRGVAPLAFLWAHWPRYVTAFDLGANVVAYLPFGLLAALALHPLLRGALAVILPACGGVLLSIALESVQTYLPARIPSNLDVLSNGAGALIGALAGALWAPRLLSASHLLALRQRWFTTGRHTDLGLTLLGLWLFTQLDPETLLFGVGDLRDLFHASPALLYPADVFIRIEAAVAALSAHIEHLREDLKRLPDRAEIGELIDAKTLRCAALRDVKRTPISGVPKPYHSYAIDWAPLIKSAALLLTATALAIGAAYGVSLLP